MDTLRGKQQEAGPPVQGVPHLSFLSDQHKLPALQTSLSQRKWPHALQVVLTSAHAHPKHESDEIKAAHFLGTWSLGLWLTPYPAPYQWHSGTYNLTEPTGC